LRVTYWVVEHHLKNERNELHKLIQADE